MDEHAQVGVRHACSVGEVVLPNAGGPQKPQHQNFPRMRGPVTCAPRHRLPRVTTTAADAPAPRREREGLDVLQRPGPPKVVVHLEQHPVPRCGSQRRGELPGQQRRDVASGVQQAADLRRINGNPPRELELLDVASAQVEAPQDLAGVRWWFVAVD